ncbi:MAG: hypothetical protein Kow0060_02660 [Methylohalobius crimeensis]
MPHQTTQVSLIFNSEIETSLSSIKLVGTENLKHPLSMEHGKNRGEIVIQLPPLAPGDYAIQYKVFATDGHLTEDVVKFHIKKEE